jgi:3-hydroxymyristoyl/3-hydroxydecanoyl-(acyl carrier protein) dehydratase
MNPTDDTVPVNDQESVPAGGPAAAASGVLRQVLHTPADLPWFQGHFPGQPILPGIVQLKWAIEAAAQLVDAPGGLHGIQQLKFKQPIRPGTTLELTLERVDAGRAIVFTFASAAGEHSSGRLCYGTA